MCFLTGELYPVGTLEAMRDAMERAMAPPARYYSEAFEILSRACAPVEHPGIKRLCNMAHEEGTHAGQRAAAVRRVKTAVNRLTVKHKAPRVQRKVMKR